MLAPVFIVCNQASPLKLVNQVRQTRPEPIIVLQMVADLPGVWTDYEPQFEWIRVGYPSTSVDPYFQYLSPRLKSKTAFHHVLERSVYTRKSHWVYCAESELIPALAIGLRPLDVRIGWGTRFARPYWLTQKMLVLALRESPLLP